MKKLAIEEEAMVVVVGRGWWGLSWVFEDVLLEVGVIAGVDDKISNVAI